MPETLALVGAHRAVVEVEGEKPDILRTPELLSAARTLRAMWTVESRDQSMARSACFIGGRSVSLTSGRE
jgi:hypothetical protein